MSLFLLTLCSILSSSQQVYFLLPSSKLISYLHCGKKKKQFPHPSTPTPPKLWIFNGLHCQKRGIISKVMNTCTRIDKAASITGVLDHVEAVWSHTVRIWTCTARASQALIVSLSKLFLILKFPSVLTVTVDLLLRIWTELSLFHQIIDLCRSTSKNGPASDAYSQETLQFVNSGTHDEGPPLLTREYPSF